MQCAEIRPDGSVAVAASQPVDVSMCTAVVMTPSDAGVFFSMPTPENFAAAWGVGFTVPLALYLVAHSVGRLIHFWD